MQIAIDGNEANVSQRVGSNVYAYELLCQLSNLCQGKHQVTVLLSTPPVDDLPSERSDWQYQVIGPRPFWTQWALPIFLFQNRNRFDVLYTPGHYAPRLTSLPYVSSVMDLGFLEFPQQFKKRDFWQLKNWTAYSVKRAAKVIAISQATKEDVVKTYQQSADKVVVAYPAVSAVTAIANLRMRSRLRELGITSPYIVYVGTLQPRKNLIRLIEAFEQVCQQAETKKLTWRSNRDGRPVQGLPQLILAGKVGWLAEPIVDRVEKSPYRERIMLSGFIDEATKTVLLQGAHCSVLIGTYEGFGIPPLESLQLGTIPVVAKATSLPEVVGRAGILVDPFDVESIAAGLIRALAMPSKQFGEWQQLAQKQAAKFSWEKSAKVVLATLEEVAAQTHK